MTITTAPYKIFFLAVVIVLLFPREVEAAVAFRDVSQSAYTTAANITATEPAACVENDIMIAWLYIESDTAVTAPANWSNSFNGTTMLAEANTAGREFRQYAYWIRRGASAPALQWTFSSSFRGIAISCYSGALLSGDPFSFGTNAVRDNATATTYPNVSGTTAVNNELLIWAGSTFDSPTAAVQPTGFTERLEANLGGSSYEIADVIQAAAGSTGTVTGASYTGSNDPTAAQMVGLKPFTASGSPWAKLRGALRFRGGLKFR